MNDYFDTLAERLRALGMPAEEVAGTVQDLAAHAADTGADPREEFGAPEEFAARLAGTGGAAGSPGPAAETWTWTADAFHEVDRLNEFGDQGWEVERIDGRARFVSRRDLNDPQRWEYRRETVRPTRGSREAVAERLAPEGWEPCGTWICFEYFKRPKAAAIGPAAGLDSVPSVPARSTYWSGGFAALAGMLVAFAALGLSRGNALMAIAPAIAALAFAIGSVVARRSSQH